MAWLLLVFYHMPRGPRNLPSAAMIHLIGRGNNVARLFHNRCDFRRFRQTLLRFIDRKNIFIHNYVLMNTHFHLLAWFEDTSVLALFIKSICVSYHHYYRRNHTYKGHLWHGRFRSVIIRDDSHWQQCARYVELNPVYAGICRDPVEYEWSSYHHFLKGKKDPLLSPILYPPPENIKTGENFENVKYREFVMAGIDLDYKKLKKQFETDHVQNFEQKLTDY